MNAHLPISIPRRTIMEAHFSPVDRALASLRENDEAMKCARVVIAARGRDDKWFALVDAEALALDRLCDLITETASDFDLERSALPETGVVVDMLGGVK